MTEINETAAEVSNEKVMPSESQETPHRDELDQPTATDQTLESAEAGEIEESEGEVATRDGEQHELLEEQMRKYKWYKCIADPTTYGEGKHYYTQTDTGESSWTEPNEPYWIWNTEAGAVDSPAGLQQPGQVPQIRPQVQPATSSYQGYNPKIHGNYDPNADYAKYHRQEQAPELTAYVQPANLDAAAEYASAMSLNRYSGAAQSTDHGPERHSDAAKSARQMNAFFDVDAAANAHDGRSLKAERQAQKLSKQQVKEFNAKRAERKHKKRMQQLLS